MSGNPAEESAAWHDWRHAVMRRAFEASQVRDAIEAKREEQERLARIEARHDPDFEAFRARATGEPPRTLDSILADLRAIPDKWWDESAEPGSASNPVRLDAPQPAAQRSRPVSDVQRLLDRAAAADARFRQIMIRYHETRAQGEISR